MERNATAIASRAMLWALVGILFRGTCPAANQGGSAESWESLDRRPVAQWWTDAKFGVYIHWTLASVPAWGLHGSFYWPNLLESREKEQGGKHAAGDTYDEQYAGLWQFHVKNYGADFGFEQFAPMFRAELFDPDRWADVFGVR